MDEIKANCLAVADQEAFVGDISLAAPVFDAVGVVAAVNVAVPFPRWVEMKARTLIGPQVVATAACISEALGGSRRRLRPATDGGAR